ncbi:ankyrin-1-like [Haliotis rubra]|uniref:ankyrin-1-like n=1 Tax=Haliotis rubra TaxID=36100 RepID=UPI001EE6156A|nr:ankyrin-1-like [Haliotis rubra]XP_046543712.1 ankyrin-1-like [Haliotis rubra]
MDERSLPSTLEVDMTCLKSLVQDGTLADIKDFLKDHTVEAADILNKAPWKDGNPLVWACQRNVEDIVTLLLEHGADPNYAHPELRIMPLHYASDQKTNNLGIVKKLLDSGARVNDVSYGEQRTALHYGCKHNNKDVVGLLLAQGAVVDLMDAFMCSPLCIVKSLPIAKMLIDAGSDVNWRNGYPFHEHACRGNVEMVEFLMEHGASFNKNFITLTYVCGRGSGHGRLLELMISEGGSPNEALKSIVMENDAKNVPEAMEYLIRAGASVNHELFGNFGWRPLHMACRLYRLDKAKLLLDWGAKTNETEEQDTEGLETEGERIGGHESQGQEMQGPKTQALTFPPLFQFFKGDGVTRRKRSRRIPEDVVISITELLRAAGAPIKEANMEALHKYLECLQENVQQRMKSLLDWYLHQPRTLREICRIAIRAAVPPKKDRSIDQLAIPSSYKGYLKFNDIDYCYDF